ncbi:unnamed protein product [Parascedosporium putredinis]|uniref:Uncharacterized protein n=1 Tax=Parascedosporium putredinis TaxID=1442378 RepID=A0A9P1H1Y3_9PEZI|nr:unnamed protein product [Parascedosporium putredinis]CAI7994239.1 unnamed protein product [Parascedosporium putredinis]
MQLPITLLALLAAGASAQRNRWTPPAPRVVLSMRSLDHEDSPPLNQDPDIQTRILTTIFDVPGPSPTVVTTYITIYTSVAPAPSPQNPQPPVTITVIPDTPIQPRQPKEKRWEA